MGNKKIGAYVVDEYGQYLKDERHRVKVFYIWEALRLRGNDIHGFNKLKFMSTQRDPAKRAEMSVVKNGFYRYKSAVTNADKYNDDDSLSHSIAIQVLSEMEKISFVFGNDRCNVSVNDIRLDDLKIQLTNIDKYDYYYPDLICFFSSPDALALKWGGKIAIEVKHTHPCEKEKIHDFESHGIPIIEVSIDKISIERILKTKSPSPDQLEKYYSYLKNIFSKQVYGRVISDPVSVEYYKKKERVGNGFGRFAS